MKIIVTGSLGHISKPLAAQLIAAVHSVTIISTTASKRSEIEALGATAAIGSVLDSAFLASVFTGADAVYCMVPPNYSAGDQISYYTAAAKSYTEAIRKSGIKRAVTLSSYGAHLEKATGFIVGSNRMEGLFNELTEVDVTHMRPGYFYYNLLNFIGMIKMAGFIGANYGGSDKLPLVAPEDIAAAIAAEIVVPFSGKKITYVMSDDRRCSEIAGILGKVTGKPDLQWNIMTNEQMRGGLEGNGVPPHIAANLVELGAAIHSGALLEDIDHQKPFMGKIKIEDYAKDFAAAFNQN